MKTSSSYKLRHIVSLMSISLILCALFAGVFVGVTYADGQGMIALLDSVDLDDVVFWTLEEEPVTYPYFYVNVTITNVTDVISAPFSVHWDPTILSLTDIIQGNFLEPPGTGGISSPLYMVNYTAGYLEDYAYTQVHPFAPKSFPATTWGWVATLTFEFIGTPPTAGFPIDTDIVFVNEPPKRPTYWFDSVPTKHNFAQMLPCHFHYETPQVHDVAITDIRASSYEVNITTQSIVTISVDIANEGDFPETFSVTVRYDSEDIDTKTVTDLPAGDSTTVDFEWDVTGVPLRTYEIEAEAILAGDDDPTDNKKTSERTIEIVPEFPTLMPLLLMLAVLAVSAIILKRRTHKHPLTRRLRQ